MEPTKQTMRERLLAALGGGRILRYRDLRDLSVVPNVLAKLAQDGTVTRQGDGYRLARFQDASPLQLIAARYPKGVLCLLTAQLHHGLTEATESHYQVAIPRTAARRGERMPIDGISDLRLGSWRLRAFYEVGIEQIDVGGGTKMACTDRWRTAADMWRPRHFVDAEQAENALGIIAREDGRVGLNKVITYAADLGFAEDVLPHVQAMASLVEKMGKPKSRR